MPFGDNSGGTTMAKRKNNNNNNNKQKLQDVVVFTRSHTLDTTDYKILQYLVGGAENKDIAREMNIPINTIQRRVKRLIDEQWIRHRMVPNYKKMRYNKGFLHLSITNGNKRHIADIFKDRPGVIEISSQVGNSDLVITYAHTNNEEIEHIMDFARNLEGIKSVTWSTESWSQHVAKLPIQLL